MIRNLVFDMGNVLMDYNPVRVCYEYTRDAGEVEWIRKELFGSEEWILLDQGMISEEEAIARIQKRLPNDRLRGMASACLAHWHEYNVEPKPGMEALIREMKERGFGIYVCSNASLRLRAYESRLPGSRYFDGVLVSAEEKLLKPDPAIYKRLFEKFSLCPEECFFIDDLPENIEGARSCGMDGYCFADGNVEKLREHLLKLSGQDNGRKALISLVLET